MQEPAKPYEPRGERDEERTEHLDGLILTGGGDHNPLWMGEEPSPRLHNINQERDAAELMITYFLLFSDVSITSTSNS